MNNHSIVNRDQAQHPSHQGNTLNNSSVSITTLTSNKNRSSGNAGRNSKNRSCNSKSGEPTRSPVQIHYHDLNFVQVTKTSSPAHNENPNEVPQVVVKRATGRDSRDTQTGVLNSKPKARQGDRSSSHKSDQPDCSLQKKPQVLAKHASQNIGPSQKRQVSQASSNSGVSASTNPKGAAIIHPKVKKDGVPASRASSNHRASGHPNSPVGGLKNLASNTGARGGGGGNEGFMVQLQDSLLK